MLKRALKAFVPEDLWLRLSGARAEARYLVRQVGQDTSPGLVLAMYADRFQRIALGRPGRVRRLRLDGYRYPVNYRPGTDDLGIISQILIRREYECVAHERNVSLILDCGANIGCTSFFFLHRYPEARVIAVEPDPGNFEVCRRNLKPFGDRVVLVNSGVWPTARPLCVVRGDSQTGGECGFQVRPASDGETADLLGTTIADLIDGSGFPMVDILKIDVEGAEAELFAEGAHEWLFKTGLLAIELHGPECERAFFEVMSGLCKEILTSGELTICRGIGAPSAH